jgi:selenocysteine lyase/cysteine desulfurase
MPGMIGLGASLDLLAGHGAGPTSVSLENRLLEITALACQRVSAAGARVISRRDVPKHASGIVAFELPGEKSAAVRQRLWNRDVILSVRNGWLRIAPHVYTNEDDIERLVAGLAAS